MPFARRVFEPLVVHCEPLHEVFAQSSRGPLPELSTTWGLHPVSNRQNHFKGIVLGIVRFPIGGSYPEFPDN